MLKLIRWLLCLLSTLLLLDHGIGIFWSLLLRYLLVLSWQTLAMWSSSLLGLWLRSLTTVHSFSLPRFVKSCARSGSTNALGLTMRVDHLHWLRGGGKVRNIPRGLFILSLTIDILTQNSNGTAWPLVLHLLWLSHKSLFRTLRFLLTKFVFEL